MKNSQCPVDCGQCATTPVFTEVEHTIIVRGNPDKEMTYTRKGYLCESKSFFFTQKDFLLEEEALLNRFAQSVS